jgi:ATP-dependent helicase/nuclease subunit A
MPQDIKHQAIMASAGSGKTYQLAHRYIRLLAFGIAPENIIALTFSRKAAGEIFDSIIKYLCEASSSLEQASKMGHEICEPALKPDDYLSILRKLLNTLHRLHTGTLDSFTVGMLRAFPLELGVSPDFDVMDNEGMAAKALRYDILAKIFNGNDLDVTAQSEFFSAFKQATHGREEKGTMKILDEFVGEYRSYYQQSPEKKDWGNVERIWKNDAAWLKETVAINDAATRLLELFYRDGLPEKAMQRWTIFIECAQSFCCGSAWNAHIEYLFSKLTPLWSDLTSGNAIVTMDRKNYELSSEECRLVLIILNNILRAEFTAIIERTQGIYGVMDVFEKTYDLAARRQGKLTFTDVQYLLTRANRQSRGVLISREPGKKDCLYIDYRLDANLDHWLLDEFQDTSGLQWEALSNLADEILCDKSGSRSFFYVGDMKQAIYSWRGGNAQLFQRILSDYADYIDVSPLSVSFRSCQYVIDSINAVFNKLPIELIPAPVIERWGKIWQEHGCAEGSVPSQGYTALIEPVCIDGKAVPVEERYRVVADLVNEISPLKRNLSVAVLVRSNKAGKEVVDYLRANCPSTHITHEGIATIIDNPISAIMLSLVKFAFHPGDTLAWRHIQMSPLGKYIETENISREELPVILLHEIYDYGFQKFLRHWGAELESCCTLDGFGRMRLVQLTDAAAEFDKDGSRNGGAFLRFMNEYQIHEAASENAVRVMTIHQSKGLGFDIVILPDLQSKNIIRSEPDFLVGQEVACGKPAWLLKLPRRLVAEADPVLAAALKTANKDKCFDNLCLLYVALTRAKQALYIVTGFPGKSSKITTYATVIKKQLAKDTIPVDGPNQTINGNEITCLYEHGTRDWYKNIPIAREKPITVVPEIHLPEGFFSKTPIEWRTPVLPSAHQKHDTRAVSLFSGVSSERMDFGSKVHELFARVTWIDEMDMDGLIRQWQESSALSDEMEHDITQHFLKAIAAPEVREALSRTDHNLTLWREKSFDVILHGQWTSGVFDRVIITHDQNGTILNAIVQDFKSDYITDDSELGARVRFYSPQISSYQKALATILKLDLAKIVGELIFTQPGKVCNL